MRYLLFLFFVPTLAAITLAELPRAEICLNGPWDTVFNAAGEKMFFSDFYEKAYTGGGTGLIVQHMPLTVPTPSEQMNWLSESGEGNRPSTFRSPSGSSTAYSKLFAELYTTFTKEPAKPQAIDKAPELLVSKFAPAEVALLIPADPASDKAVGVTASGDGTAWIFAPASGNYVLTAGPHQDKVRLNAGEVNRHTAPR